MKFVFNMMKGEQDEKATESPPAMLALPAPPQPRVFVPPMELESAETMAPFGISLSKEPDGDLEE